MRRKVIKNIKELSNAWMMLYTACSEEVAVQLYQKRYGCKPKSVIVLEQGEGSLIYMDIPFKG